jgi:hypothetical protein
LNLIIRFRGTMNGGSFWNPNASLDACAAEPLQTVSLMTPLEIFEFQKFVQMAWIWTVSEGGPPLNAEALA